MSLSRKFRNQEKLHFVTFSVIRWLDVFTRREYKDIVVDSLTFCIKNKGLELYAWVIMSNHVHLIIGTNDKPLEGILRDLKKHTSKELTKAIGENAQESRREWLMWFFEREGKLNPNNTYVQFWQQGNHPIELWSNELIDQKLIIYTTTQLLQDGLTSRSITFIAAPETIRAARGLLKI